MPSINIEMSYYWGREGIDIEKSESISNQGKRVLAFVYSATRQNNQSRHCHHLGEMTRSLPLKECNAKQGMNAERE